MSKSPIRSTHTNVVWVAVAVAIIFLAAAGIWGPRVPRPHLNALTAAAPIALVLITIVYVVATNRAASAAERAADAAEVAASSASASAEAGLRQAQLMEEQTTHQALPIVWGAAIGIEDARIKVRVDNVGLGTALNLCLWAVSQAGAHSDTVVLPAPLKGGSELPGLIGGVPRRGANRRVTLSGSRPC